MKRNFSINISGFRFNIEDDAYEVLKKFVSNNRGNNDTQHEEKPPVNINTIEGRIAKVLNKLTLNGQKTISIETINQAIELISSISDDDYQSSAQHEAENVNHSVEDEKKQTTRKYYRDPDSRILGGVCSGLGHYFQLDKALIRVLFVIFFFVTSGAALLAYIILWVAAPSAKSPLAKNEMTKNRRVPINKTNHTNVNDQMNERHNNLIKPRKNNADNIIAKIFGVFFLIFGFALLTLLTIGIVFSSRVFGVIPFFSDGIILNHLISESFASTLLLSLLFIVGIPLLLIIYAGIKLLFNYVANSKSVFNTALVAWIIALIIFIGSLTGAIKNLRTNSMESSEIKIENTMFPLTVKINDNSNYYKEFRFQFNNYKVAVLNKKEHIIARPSFSIKKTNNVEARIKITKTEKGKTAYFEKNNTLPVDIVIESVENQLIIDPYFALKPGEKWRLQKVDIILELPVGSIIYIDENMYPILKEAKNQSDTWVIDMVGSYWSMENDGLKKIENINL
jgi:phage shock protein PspC (stress-responsive transcriptional regulator)